MTHVFVLVRCRGTLIEDRLCRLEDGLRLGDTSRAAVIFPGAVLVVERDAMGWRVAGHRLVAGRQLVLQIGDYEVSLEGIVEAPSRRDPLQGFDLGILVATAAILLLALWLDGVQRTVDDHADTLAGLQARLFGAEDVRDPEAEALLDTGAYGPGSAPGFGDAPPSVGFDPGDPGR